MQGTRRSGVANLRVRRVSNGTRWDIFASRLPSEVTLDLPWAGPPIATGTDELPGLSFGGETMHLFKIAGIAVATLFTVTPSVFAQTQPKSETTTQTFTGC